MRRQSAISALLVAALVMSGWAGTGCGGGGGGGGGGPTEPPPPASSISFSADASAGANSIYLSSGGGSGSVFILEVDAQSVTDLYGASFVVSYPDDLLDFTRNSEEEGSFLSESGSVDTDLQVSERTSGEIVVGVTRLGEEPGASGSGNLVSLRFTRRAAGSGPIEMVDQAAVDSFGDVQEDVTWIGGSVTVR
jgi:hypothetical protein